MSAILIARGISYGFANGRELFSNLSLSLSAKPAALVGPNGVGKTHLARLLAGEIRPSTGTVDCSVAVKLLPQRELPAAVTVAEYLSDAHEWSLLRAKLLEQLLGFSIRLGIDRAVEADAQLPVHLQRGGIAPSLREYLHQRPITRVNDLHGRILLDVQYLIQSSPVTHGQRLTSKIPLHLLSAGG